MSERRLELVSTVLLSLATVATAWSAYQARQWTGAQSQAYSRATATRIAVNRYAAVANRQVQIDVATFVQWVDAREAGKGRLARFYRARFRPEFAPAFAAWLAQGGTATPFALRQYRLASADRADRLEAVAAGISQQAKAANEQADDDMLAVVLFACALFFAGLSTKLGRPGPRTVVLGLGALLFLGTVGWLVTMPARV